MADRPGPLTGVKAITCSTAQAGTVPYMLMADLGAEVIKIESLDGDHGRHFESIRGRRAELEGDLSAYFEGMNRQKLGMALNLKTPSGVESTDGNGEVSTYDAVVVATHPHQALALLAEPTSAHREVLGAMPYALNTALLHTDTSLMPQLTQTWASWNFRRPPGEPARTESMV